MQFNTHTHTQTYQGSNAYIYDQYIIICKRQTNIHTIKDPPGSLEQMTISFYHVDKAGAHITRNKSHILNVISKNEEIKI